MNEPREFGVVLKPAEEGGYTVSVPDLPGCHTEGDTWEEALEMAKDAIEGYLQVLADEGRPLRDLKRGLLSDLLAPRSLGAVRSSSSVPSGTPHPRRR